MATHVRTHPDITPKPLPELRDLLLPPASGRDAAMLGSMRESGKRYPVSCPSDGRIGPPTSVYFEGAAAVTDQHLADLRRSGQAYPSPVCAFPGGG